MNIREYKKIAQLGDRIETNGQDNYVLYEQDDNGDDTEETIWRSGEVVEIKENGFYFKTSFGHTQYVLWDNDDCEFVLIKSALPIATEIIKPIEPKKKRKIVISLEKDAQNMLISLKLPKEIEEYFQKISKGEAKTSKAWFQADGTEAKFYPLSKEQDQAERAIEPYSFSDYGDGLIKGDRINTAILRTIGTSKGIKIKSSNFNMTNNIDLEYYTKRLGVFVKKLWETSIGKKKIKSVITYEI